jgi:hypothetical protein
MKKLPQILLIVLLGLITPTKAQEVLNPDSVSFISDNWIDSIKAEYNKYKEHLIATDQMNPNWLKVRIGFNYQCDTIFFQGDSCNLPKFNQKFKDFLLSKAATDTTVLQIVFGDHIDFGLIIRAFDILARPFDKYIGHGTYYFKVYEPPREKQNM